MWIEMQSVVLIVTFHLLLYAVVLLHIWIFVATELLCDTALMEMLTVSVYVWACVNFLYISHSVVEVLE